MYLPNLSCIPQVSNSSYLTIENDQHQIQIDYWSNKCVKCNKAAFICDPDFWSSCLESDPDMD